MKIPNILGRRRSEKQIAYLSKQMDKSVEAKKAKNAEIVERNKITQRKWYAKNKNK